ncbi:MAG: ABC transporter permease [Alsobacter sp.]
MTRVLPYLLVLLGVSAISFALLHLIPGDPAQTLLGFEADQQALDALRARWRLDAPLPVQYVAWLGNILHGDWGRSTSTGEPVLNLLLPSLAATLELATMALLVSTTIAVPAAFLSASSPRSTSAGVLSATGLLLQSIPSFCLGTLLVLGFAIAVPILPASGSGGPDASVVERLSHLLLPTLTVAAGLAGGTMRQMRSAFRAVLDADFVRAARARGMRSSALFRRHVFPHACVVLVTILGLQWGHLIGGVVVAETVFAWPGLGKLTVDAIFARDYPLVLGAVLLSALTIQALNLSTDVVCDWIDPRKRSS